VGLAHIREYCELGDTSKALMRSASRRGDSISAEKSSVTETGRPVLSLTQRRRHAGACGKAHGMGKYPFDPKELVAALL
jgi:hypothetical protein